MSDFAGLWRLDGKPVDGGDFNRLAQGLDGRGVASARFWRAGPVGLVHRQHGFTPEDGIERLPRVGASGAVLVADLRLNDRANLMRALDLPVVGAAYADGALLLHAVERWGTEAALARLYGDYAFAVWDPAGRRLTLARDPAGARALFVHRGERLIAFSTRLRALLALPEVPRDLDERAVADHLQCLPGRPSRTLYRAIDRVPMGHLAVLSREDTRLIRWWTLPQPGPSRSARDDEVEERARDVLDRAVADSLRSSQPVTLMLTGGLDSGAVVASAARQSAPPVKMR